MSHYLQVVFLCNASLVIFFIVLNEIIISIVLFQDTERLDKEAVVLRFYEYFFNDLLCLPV